MLLQMRTFTRSILAYLLLFVLVIAFAMWGINDVFNRSGRESLAKVGNLDVTPAQLSRELELQLRAQRRQGRNLSQEDAIRAGLHTRILDSLITRTALDGYAEKLGVAASDAQVAARIRELPAAHNAVGAFDQSAYTEFLRQLGYTPADFERDIRSDLTIQMLLEPITAGLRVPSSYGKLALTFEGERRVVSIAEAPAGAVGPIPAASEADLRDLYQDNQEAFRVPEYRTLTIVFARASDFAARVNVPEERIREEFEGRRAAAGTPEKRSFVRFTARDEAQARDIAARLTRGDAPDAIARATGAAMARGADQARNAVSDENVAGAVFSTPAGQPRVVRGALAPWVVVRVDAITAAVEPSFASMHDAIRGEIAAEEGSDAMNAAVSAFEDARSAGTPVAQAARTANLTVTTIAAVDAQGRDREGHPIEAIASQQELLQTAFQTQEGEASDFMPVGDADTLISVDHIIAASVRPFDQVRPRLAEVWVGRERVRRLNELGAEIQQQVAAGQSFAAVARAHRIPVLVASQPLDRRNAQQIPARNLAGQLFGADEGAVVSDMRVDGGALLIGHLEHIMRPDLTQLTTQIEGMRAQLQDPMRNSLAEAVTSEVTSRAHPRRNQRLIDQLYPRARAGEEDQAPAQQ